MIELRWVVLDGTFVPGEYPKLQYRYQRQDMKGFHPDMRWSAWIVVPTVVAPNEQN